MLGAEEGAGVLGVDEGAKVVGRAVGSAVGIVVGEGTTGDGDGAMLGAFVGVAVGAGLGAMVGEGVDGEAATVIQASLRATRKLSMLCVLKIRVDPLLEGYMILLVFSAT